MQTELNCLLVALSRHAPEAHCETELWPNSCFYGCPSWYRGEMEVWLNKFLRMLYILDQFKKSELKVRLNNSLEWRPGSQIIAPPEFWHTTIPELLHHPGSVYTFQYTVKYRLEYTDYMTLQYSVFSTFTPQYIHKNIFTEYTTMQRLRDRVNCRTYPYLLGAVYNNMDTW